MTRRVTVPQASTITGLSEYAIRKGVKERRYPHIRTGLGVGKILIDIDLLEQYLAQEARDNATCENSNIIHFGQLRRLSE